MSIERERLEAAAHASAEWIETMVAAGYSIKPPVLETVTANADYLMALCRNWMTNGDEYHGQMVATFVLAAQWWATDMQKETEMPSDLNPSDLDRCEHGRHVHDNCFSCPGRESLGNPHLVDNPVIGYSLRGDREIRLRDLVDQDRVDLTLERRS